MSPFEVIPILITVVPMVMVGLFIFVVVKMIRPAQARSAAPLKPGQAVSLHALFLPDVTPGTLITFAQVNAPSGRITLTPDELIWEPQDGPVPPWRMSLAHVHVVERPPMATGILILSVNGRLLGLVVDPKRRPNRLMRNDIADLRQAKTGAWFADLIDAAHQRAAAWSPPPQ